MSSPSSSSESAIVLESNKSSPSPSGKLCIVSNYSSGRACYAVFIVDLESPVVDVDHGFFTPSAPTILIDRASMGRAKYYEFCVLHSTLYLFQNSGPGLPLPGTSVYTYDLSSHLSVTTTTTTTVVDKSMLCPSSDMLWPKNNPSATPTPDGNGILVFSSVIDFGRLYNDFELYLPDKKELPSLKRYLIKIGAKTKGGQYGIYSYAFITNSVFLIQIEFGVFTIDINIVEPFWEKYSDPIHSAIFHVIEGDMLWLTDDGAYDISNGVCDMFDHDKVSPFPSRSSFGIGFKSRMPISFCLHTIYDTQGNVFGIVQLQLSTHKHTNCAHMILEVCSFDLDKYRNDKKKNMGADARLESSLIKSFKFVMDGYYSDFFHILYLSHIQPGTK